MRPGNHTPISEKDEIKEKILRSDLMDTNDHTPGPAYYLSTCSHVQLWSGAHLQTWLHPIKYPLLIHIIMQVGITFFDLRLIIIG